MSVISTHVLDLSLGKPAAGVDVTLQFLDQSDWTRYGTLRTGVDGRVADLLARRAPLRAGRYRLNFQTESYFRSQGLETFFPEIEIQFRVSNPREHHHVPLLLSPYGYSVYRGAK